MTTPLLSEVVDFTASAIEHVDLDAADTHDLMHSVDRLLDAGVKLQRHLAYHPDAKVDRHGRCHQCARLLAVPLRPRLGWRDTPRGCFFVPGLVVAYGRWFANLAMSLPLVGKALWLLRRRGGT